MDETLYPMRHQIAFRQYNPNKPHHYGFLFQSLNDVRYPYTCKSFPYPSKPKSGQGPYYIESKIDNVKYLISKTEEQNLHGQNISTYLLYTSVELPKMVTNKKHHNHWNSTEGLAWNTSRIIWCKRKRKIQCDMSLQRKRKRHVHNIIYCYYKV